MMWRTSAFAAFGLIALGVAAAQAAGGHGALPGGQHLVVVVGVVDAAPVVRVGEGAEIKAALAGDPADASQTEEA